VNVVKPKLPVWGIYLTIIIISFTLFAVNTLSLSIKNVRQPGTPRREFVPGYPANICSSHNYNTGHFCEETTIIFLVFSYFEGVSPCGNATRTEIDALYKDVYVPASCKYPPKIH